MLRGMWQCIKAYWKLFKKQDKSSIHINFDGVSLEQVKEQEYSGIWFNEEFNW